MPRHMNTKYKRVERKRAKETNANKSPMKRPKSDADRSPCYQATEVTNNVASCCAWDAGEGTSRRGKIN